MIHTRTHMYEETKKALTKAKREINKLTYEEMTKEKIDEILNGIYEENKGNEWFEQIKFYDRITTWIKEKKFDKWQEYLKQFREEK